MLNTFTAQCFSASNQRKQEDWHKLYITTVWIGITLGLCADCDEKPTIGKGDLPIWKYLNLRLRPQIYFDNDDLE